MAQAVGKPSPNGRRHRVLGVLSGVFALLAMAGAIARVLPEKLQALPYVPMVVSLTPWFAIAALASLLLAMVARRRIIALLALICLGLQIWWQYPFFAPSAQLPTQALQAVAAANPNTADGYARVMTLNTYKGQADPNAIVALVREQRVEVLAMQETTDVFVRKLKDAGIEHYLPYSQVASMDGVFGNGLWSATPLGNPSDDDVNSSASYMPGGTVAFNGGTTKIRFVSVHTTSPVSGYWNQWKRSIDELAAMRSRTGARYVFMGDFNATTDHTPFRDFLGNRFIDAAQQSGHGFTFTWPMNRVGVPAFSGIDHVVLDRGMVAGQMAVVKMPGSDHAALLATIGVGK